jgi:hypothetical protein
MSGDENEEEINILKTSKTFVVQLNESTGTANYSSTALTL